MARAAGRLGLPPGTASAARAVLARPDLWRPALRQARLLVPRGWWGRAPYLPVPDRQWLAFRLTTAYGDRRAEIDPDDLLTWLAWSKTVLVPSRATGSDR